MRLSDMVGQEHAIAVLERALAAGRLAHAYVFDGPEGVGKRTTAQALGLALVCEREPRVGCGRCETCSRAIAGYHPDVFTFDAAALPELVKASTEKSAIKYAARNVFPYALSPPHEARARILILDHAEELSPDVQNTLLKTLEEPRAAAHIVLVAAARDRLLPTILSRTQRVRFLPVRPAAIRAIAASKGIDAARAEAAAVLAGGSVARLLALAGADGEALPWQEVTTLRQAAAGRGAAVLFDAGAALGDKESKDRLPAVLALLAGIYRDAITVAAGAPELVLLGERRSEIEALAAGPGAGPRLGRALRAVLEAEEALAGNVNAALALERLMMQLRRCERSAAS
jgi:DNA polymerase III subunit delta'